MHLFKKTLKVVGITMGSMLAFMLLTGIIFLYVSPQFGGSPSQAQLVNYTKSGHFEDGIFVNPIPTDMSMSFKTIVSLLGDYARGIPNQRPAADVPVQKIDSLDIVNHPDTLTRLTWFGHSAFLLEINGKNILIDPMLGDSPSPLPFLGTTRYSKELPIEIEQLPAIDAVLISHDHYDHLDYGSIQNLKNKTKHFYVALGVGNHLAAWGIDSARIHELNWGETLKLDNLTFTATPARHFSGRGLSDRFATLWCSWVIQSPTKKIFFSGDSGYGPHFKEIGNVYGPFDLALLECGQYDTRWQNIHMLPEQTVQAALDVKAKLMMPIHWGAFTLALHSWTEPVTRSSAEAKKLNVSLATPAIGEPFILSGPIPQGRWWEEIGK